MSGPSPDLAVVIPAYNEEATIHDVAAGALKQVSLVIVVDDGSQDQTAAICRMLPLILLRHSRNLGKASALWLGMEQAMTQEAQAIITLDGDGQHDPEDIPALLAMHRRDPQALVIGSRLHHVRRIPPARYVANRLADFWISWAARQAIADSQSGFRVYPAPVLQTVGHRCDRKTGFVFESEMLIEAGRAGIPIRSVPISVRYGRHLRESHFRQGRDIARITRMVARKLLARRMDLAGLAKSFRTPSAPPITTPLLDPSGPSSREPFRRRILFIAESVTLAHMARAVALASALDPHRYDVHVACDARYLSLFQSLPGSVHSLESISSACFQQRLAEGRPLYTSEELRAYVTDELRLFADLAPDVVVGDFRLSLSVSARLAGVPYLTVTNAHWSPYARPRFIVPALAITNRFGPRLGQALFSLMRPVVFAYHAYALNKVRRDYGLPSVGYSLPHIFTEADEILYADLPEVVPTFDLPRNHHYIGPVLWSPTPTPPWWDTVPEDRPMVYVNLGSSGRCDVLPPLLETLDRLGIKALVSTAGRKPPPDVPDHVWTSEYMPGLKAAERADFVICNGGSGTAYQALAAGVPVLGIPHNLDQYLMMFYLQKFGAGEYVRTDQASVPAFTRAVNHILHTITYRERAAVVQTMIRSGRSAERFGDLLARLSGLESEGLCTMSPGRPHIDHIDSTVRSPGSSRGTGDVRHAPDMQC